MNDVDWPLEQHPEFKAIWDKVAPFTMTSPARGFALWQAVNHVIDNDIPGAFVDCGCRNGGSSMLIAMTLRARGAFRELILFDTFAGMTPPGPDDVDLNGAYATDMIGGEQKNRTANHLRTSASLEEVKRTEEISGYDPRLIRYVEGEVTSTLSRTQTLRIALLRLGVDAYDDTIAELRHLYPRVSAGGPIIIDDYGDPQGAKKAVDEYLAQHVDQAHRPLLWAPDSSGRGFIKTEPPGNVEIERYDYVPQGMHDPELLPHFPSAKIKNPWTVNWPHLRPSAPHLFRCDERLSSGATIGNASYEEAICLHNIAKLFRGRRGLEIGSHFGWTGAHLLAAGLELDMVDPAFEDPEREEAVRAVLDQIPDARPYRLWARYSPDCLQEVMDASTGPWSFVFIDGDHDGDAPAADARAVIGYCAEDAVIMFHDITSPDVAKGLGACKDAGWNVRLFNTMQVLGVAWRGEVAIPEHVADPNVPRLFYPHLAEFL